MNNFTCPDLSQIIDQLFRIESSWKLTIHSLKRRARRSNVCTCTSTVKTRRGAYRLSEPSCLTGVKNNYKRQSVTYGVSKPYNHIGRPQNRKVNQRETKILKFSLSPLLFPFPDFR